MIELKDFVNNISKDYYVELCDGEVVLVPFDDKKEKINWSK